MYNKGALVKLWPTDMRIYLSDKNVYDFSSQ